MGGFFTGEELKWQWEQCSRLQQSRWCHWCEHRSSES